MKRRISLIVMGLLFTCQAALAGDTITAKDVESYFYRHGKMEPDKNSPFEVTYYLEGDTITRTRVYDSQEKEVIPDNTIYYIQRQLLSDPSKGGYGRPLVIRAIGQPGSDAVEILTIGDEFILSVKSTSDYLVIRRSKRLKSHRVPYREADISKKLNRPGFVGGRSSRRGTAREEERGD